MDSIRKIVDDAYVSKIITPQGSVVGGFSYLMDKINHLNSSPSASLKRESCINNLARCSKINKTKSGYFCNDKKRIVPEIFNNRLISVNTKFTFPNCHFVGRNIWILKPTSLNRGRGIYVFRYIKKLKKIIVEYISASSSKVNGGASTSSGYSFTGSSNINSFSGNSHRRDYISEFEQLDQFVKPFDELSGPLQSFNGNSQLEGYIIQKYIENPLLINKRKFDIRLWVLINQNLDCFLFR